ncbi:Shedu immune nuclease family protein [Flagellimonas okinawensis]|uniref:DUF4263 domain-containing protein n=1 Tax=Flagellimonas okinawensis TaxID=3031324 RepID=A0ABT5XP18_9FLAO|nr:Shedu immune nuclease family protein [[Muricauda] okinawensis]MDF0707643.1 DUF4263 domain-containing protein [[Muricauda] okinawensis]
MQNLIQKIQDLEWEELNVENNQVSIQDSEQDLLSVENGIATLNLLDRKESDEGEVTFENSYINLTRLEFPTNFDASSVLTRNLKLRHYAKFNEVFDFNNRNIECISITEDTDDYEVNGNTVSISPESITAVIQTYNEIYDDAKVYQGKFVSYKSREYQRAYFGIEKERKTLSNKGEFTFLVDRFNLSTKRKKADFLKYLNDNDLISLQDLTLKLIQKEVFGSDFLIKLNDYFIKARLEDIIKLGREVLSLKSTDLKTQRAKKIIKKVEPDGRKIKQLESVWQKYFENYLSFLIFAYREIYPKIELNVSVKKKYPDFIGINHYGGVDVIEIKTHLKKALTKDPSHDNYAFSSEMSKAIIQTINYMDALIQEKIKKKTMKADIKGKILEGNIYRPEGLIVISSYDNLVSGIKQTEAEFEKVKRDFTKLRNGLNNIRIITFDELLNMAENYKDNIVK